MKHTFHLSDREHRSLSFREDAAKSQSTEKPAGAQETDLRKINSMRQEKLNDRIQKIINSYSVDEIEKPELWIQYKTRFNNKCSELMNNTEALEKILHAYENQLDSVLSTTEAAKTAPEASSQLTREGANWILRTPEKAAVSFRFKSYVNPQELGVNTTCIKTADYCVQRDQKDRSCIVITTKLPFTCTVNGVVIEENQKSEQKVSNISPAPEEKKTETKPKVEKVKPLHVPKPTEEISSKGVEKSDAKPAQQAPIERKTEEKKDAAVTQKTLDVKDKKPTTEIELWKSELKIGRTDKGEIYEATTNTLLTSNEKGVYKITSDGKEYFFKVLQNTKDLLSIFSSDADGNMLDDYKQASLKQAVVNFTEKCKAAGMVLTPDEVQPNTSGEFTGKLTWQPVATPRTDKYRWPIDVHRTFPIFPVSLSISHNGILTTKGGDAQNSQSDQVLMSAKNKIAEIEQERKMNKNKFPFNKKIESRADNLTGDQGISEIRYEKVIEKLEQNDGYYESRAGRIYNVHNKNEVYLTLNPGEKIYIKMSEKNANVGYLKIGEEYVRCQRVLFGSNPRSMIYISFDLTYVTDEKGEQLKPVAKHQIYKFPGTDQYFQVLKDKNGIPTTMTVAKSEVQWLQNAGN